MKTRAEIDDLKQQWIADPCWDIEDTEGFEAHTTELLVFRLKHELKQEREENRRYREFFAKLAELTPQRKDAA